MNLNRERIRECVDTLGERIRVIQSDGSGLVIERVGGARIRIYTGGGIAAQRQAWFDVPGMPHIEPVGPFKTKGELTKALREWRNAGRY